MGIANDGDADRCLAVTASGEVVDGDQIMAILALDLRETGALPSDTVVATVMSNLGFKLAMREAGITVVETAVGDRYVLEAMKEGGFGFGGEQSGHVIMLDHATTGDGVLTGLHLLAAMVRRGRPLDELTKVMTRLPQVLINVKDVDKTRARTPGAGRGRRRRRGRPRRDGPRPDPAERHRADGPRHGRGGLRGPGPVRRRTPRRRREDRARLTRGAGGQAPQRSSMIFLSGLVIGRSYFRATWAKRTL